MLELGYITVVLGIGILPGGILFLIDDKLYHLIYDFKDAREVYPAGANVKHELD